MKFLWCGWNVTNQSFAGKGDAQWDGEIKLANGKTTSEILWNFAFELNDPVELKEEHVLEANSWEDEKQMEADKMVTSSWRTR